MTDDLVFDDDPASFTDMVPPRPVLAGGFFRCDACAGFGFLKRGDFGYNEYAKCASCNGVGQHYIGSATRTCTALSVR